MGGVDITAESTGALATFWGMMDIFTFSYASVGDYKVINSDLYNQMPETDARRYWFYTDSESKYYLLPTGKFHSDRSSSIMGDNSWESDIHFMRVEECYLIAAEAETRLNHLSSACTYLKAILDNRDEDKAEKIFNMSQEELLNELFFEWRVEMWGEGKSLMTFKRFKKNATLSADNDYYKDQGTIDYDSPKFIFRIPNQELQYNPSMKDADQ